MSVCLESNTVISNSVSSASQQESLESNPTSSCSTLLASESSPNITKLVLSNNSSSATSVLQKVPTTSVITVVNAPGPLTILKTLCSNSYGTPAPQFTLVNSSPLNVCNAVGKPITVVGAPPITVVRAITNVVTSPSQITNEITKANDTVANIVCNSSVNGSPTATSERPSIHNVFVKNTTVMPELIPATSEVTQAQKSAPPATFLQNNVIQTVTTGITTKTVNGQKAGITTNSKLKIISNIIVPPLGSTVTPTMVTTNTTTNSNITISKPVTSKHFVQQKMVNNSLNGNSKFLNKSVNNNFVKATTSAKNMTKAQKMFIMHKSQQKMPPINNNIVSKSGIKTLSPQSRGIPNQQVQRTSSGLKTIPPQRSSKITNKPNYIGKHAIQAQKFKNSNNTTKLKNVKPPVPTSNNLFPHRMPQNTGVTYHQALTANIIQSLSDCSNEGNYSSNRNFDFPRYEPLHSYSDTRNSNDSYVQQPPPKPQSNLEALSFVCQAVLLDHNYNASPPIESPTRIAPSTSSVQLNGTSGSYYTPNTRIRSSLSNISHTPPTLSSNSSSSILPNVSNPGLHQDDDAGSEISCGSDRKLETEGEETDTAPEAEAVNNEDNYDHYGDYVTRCICGFLHDDGYMIECDKCKVWQHVRCVIKSNKKVPEDYLCEVCDPNKLVDRSKARSLQQQWMRENQEREAKLRKEAKFRELKLKETLTDSDSTDGEQIVGNILNKNRVSANSRRKSDQGIRLNPRQRRDSAKSENITRRSIKRKERRVPKKKIKPQGPKSQSDEETVDTWNHSTISQLPQLRQWIENYEEAVTNHYSPELRARISNIRINGIHSDLSQMDPSVHKCRITTQPLTSLKYLVSTMHLPPNTPVIELRGKYMLSTQHRGSVIGHGTNLTTRQHTQRPGPFLFFYRLHKDNTEVCVDTRTYGNDARFVRRSCRPNAELRHCIEKGVLHLYVVTITTVERNIEITVKHESHDLAVIGTTHIACACGKSEECLINKCQVKKNGETNDVSGLRKRRGRRVVSSPPGQEQLVFHSKLKEEIRPLSPMDIKPQVDIKVEPEPIEEMKIKIEIEDIKKIEEYCESPTLMETIKTESIKTENVKTEVIKTESIKTESLITESLKTESLKIESLKTESLKTESIKMESESRSCSPVTCIRKSISKSDSEDKKDSLVKECSSVIDKRKLSREERKIEAIMKAFERMERQEQRRQEHQAKQAHRRESEPCPIIKEEDKIEPKIKRRRRKGRARTISTTSQARRNRLNSADSSYATSGDECLLSPTDSICHNQITSKEGSYENSPNKDMGLLILADSENSNRSDIKSPIQDIDCNSNSANSSPETPLSSACLLVAAAVEPLEPNFKFPKTKKGLMNEWITKSTECIQSASSISPSALTPHVPSADTLYETTSNNNFFTANKNLITLSQANYCESPSQSHGSAKKRWLRQAISEDHSENSSNRPESPPLLETAPPKKRKLPRESLSSETSPITTPTNSNTPPILMENDKEREDRVEIVTTNTIEGESPPRPLMDDAALKERVAEMQQEIGSCFRLPEPRTSPQKDIVQCPSASLRSVLDPRLTRPIFNNSEHLVATVEKNLSILGLEEKKTETKTPTKRKLSITEYRQRKQQSINEKMIVKNSSEEQSLSSQSSPQKLRPRSDSTSSATSFMSSDDEIRPVEVPPKALSAFNCEPTELEKQRENVSLRLKKAFGFSIDEENQKPATTNVKTKLNCDLSNNTLKLQRFNESFSTSDCQSTILSETTPTVESPPTVPIEEPLLVNTEKKEAELETPVIEVTEPCESSTKGSENVKPEMFYTPDDTGEKVEEEVTKKDKKHDEYGTVESANYVPPFNNPLYPNSSFTSFGSVIDDDVPYEGRNPSPPPDLSSVPNTYLSP